MGLILDIFKFIGITTGCFVCIAGVIVGIFWLVDELAGRPVSKD